MSGDYFYTISVHEERLAFEKYGYRGDGLAGYVFAIQIPGTIPLYRLLHPTSGDHFYTTSEAERDNAITAYGYQDEGIACFVYAAPTVAGVAPLYRLANLINGHHFYTAAKAEYDFALAPIIAHSPGIEITDKPTIDIAGIPGMEGQSVPVRKDTDAPKYMYRDESIACYVHETQVDHSLPFLRLLQVAGDTPPPRRIKGFADLHNHQFANQAFGGKAFVGAAFGPIEQALPHCDYGPGDFLHPNWVHGPGGERDILGNLRGLMTRGLRDESGAAIGAVIGGLLGLGLGGVGIGVGAGLGAAIGGGGHLVGGNPEFDGWPRWNNLTHQSVYQDWLFRALQGGLKLLVVFAVNNELLAEHIERAPGRTSDDMEAVDKQIDAAYEMQAFIDEQSGGDGQGWYRIVKSPQQARDVINAGKLAVVLGIEVDYPFGCKADTPPSPADLAGQLDNYYDRGVRHIFPIHFDDNAIGGVAFQNPLVGDPAFDVPHRPYNITTRPAAGEGYDYRDGHVNIAGLTELGKFFVKAMMSKGMIIDVDHMSAASQNDLLEIAESLPGGYPVISSHTGFIDISNQDKLHEGNMKAEQVERIRNLGGMVACILNQGNWEDINTWRGSGQTVVEHMSGGTSETWAQAYLYAIEKMQGGPVGFGTDFNGMINPTGPRFGPDKHPGGTPRGGIAEPTNRVTYPLKAIATGIEMDRSVVGNKVFDINEDGLAHVGMFPDFIADLQQIGLTNEDLAPLMNSAEGYIQMWEKAEMYKPAAPAAPFESAPSWSQSRSGFLQTNELVDVISYRIVPGAIGDDAVEFVLAFGPNLTWRKELILVADDGQWTIHVEGDTRSNQNGLYRYQLPNGQLVFRKKKGLLQALEIQQVLSLSQLNDLPLGARVTFSWLQD